MSGDMSMAPIITAVEWRFSPNEEIKMAKTSTQKVGTMEGDTCANLPDGLGFILLGRQGVEIALDYLP